MIMPEHPLTTRRRGLIVHEATVAMLLAAAILTSIVHVLAFSAQQSRAWHQRLTATREAGDLMEQLMARSWEQLTPDTAARLTLSENGQAALPNAWLEIEIVSGDTTISDTTSRDAAISDATAGAGPKRLRIEIVWGPAAGNQAAPVRLVAWKYPQQEIGE